MPDSQAELMSEFSARIASLERSNRRFRRAIICMASCFVGIVAIGAADSGKGLISRVETLEKTIGKREQFKFLVSDQDDTVWGCLEKAFTNSIGETKRNNALPVNQELDELFRVYNKKNKRIECKSVACSELVINGWESTRTRLLPHPERGVYFELPNEVHLNIYHFKTTADQAILDWWKNGQGASISGYPK